MKIFWAGGEDTDYARLGTAFVDTSTGAFRAGWARCDITQAGSSTSFAQTWPFNGGPLTSAWLSFRHIASVNNSMLFGFGLSGTTKGLGLAISGGSKCVLAKYDGTTQTNLVSEPGNSIGSAILHRIDIQLINYGAGATVNVFVDGYLNVTYTGDVTVTGMTNFDCLTLWPIFQGGGGLWNAPSEIIVADSDTRTLQGLQTMVPNGAGTTNNWVNNTPANITAITLSDNNPVSVNTIGQDQQFNITDPTSLSFSTIAFIISARIAKTTSAVPTQVKLGYRSGGSVAFGSGATKTPDVGYKNYQQIDAINPVTGNPFTVSEITALQLDLQSA